MASNNPKPRCFLCGRNHPLKYCLSFRKLMFDERRNALKGQDICLNCFGHGHKRSSCPSTNRCEVCKSKHHSMIHRPRAQISYSSDEAPAPTEQKLILPPIVQDEWDLVPFHERLITYKDARPYDWKDTNQQEPTEIVPIIQCKIKAEDRSEDVTLMLCNDVPKSHLIYDSIKNLLKRTPFTSNLPYGLFELLHPEGSIKERFIIVKKLQIYVPPAIQNHNLITFANGRKLAHPEPHNYNKIDGIIGKDLEERIMRGSAENAEKNPNIWTQETVFGVVFGGTWARSNIPFLKSLCPLERREDGPFSSRSAPS